VIVAGKGNLDQTAFFVLHQDLLNHDLVSYTINISRRPYYCSPKGFGVKFIIQYKDKHFYILDLAIVTNYI